MRDTTLQLLENFEIMQLGYDFAGYYIDDMKDVSFHHYLVAKRECKRLKLGNGYEYQNGVILNITTSHPELHIMEVFEPKSFQYITSEFLDMKIKGHLDVENIKNIHTIMMEFEYKYKDAITKKGEKLIKAKYTKGRVNLF